MSFSIADIRPLLRRGAIILPVLAMVFLTASSPQCARTSDRVLAPAGSSVLSAEVGQCIAGCAHEAADKRSLELDEYVAIKQACGDDPECHQTASGQHVAALAAIQHEFKLCMSRCHDQGEGSGGN